MLLPLIRLKNPEREKQMGVERDFSEFNLGLIKLKIPREYLNKMFTRHWICASETQGKSQE